MKKSITKEQIIETALDLLKDKSDIRSVNLREIARVLGCAHTNLYNYFPSFNDLLWEAHMEIENQFIKKIALELESVQDDKLKFYQFYFSLSELYLDHKGWFRLAWLDYIDDARPEQDKITTEKAVKTMVEILESIWLGIYPNAPARERIHSVLHDVHCYIVGEVSNFINGRGLIQDSEMLKRHIAETAVIFFTLALKEE
ncbi:MAG TPA: TetR/AcrR family transcriptional regulator [Clostridiaceae bacterium]|nr:TetR/AcrR family transcriptional regulator [Clostridiaceae bacterium]